MSTTDTSDRAHRPVPPGSVVVGLDGSPHARLALGWAADQAAAEHRALTLAHAVPPMVGIWLDPVIDHKIVPETAEATGRALLAEAKQEVHESHPGLVVHEAVQVADPRDLLLGLGRQAAMLVVGSRGRGPVRSLLLGSVGVAVVRHAPCPVVVVRPGDSAVDLADQHHPGVLVGVDGSEHSVEVLDAAYRQASLHRLPLTVVHCSWDALSATDQAHLVDPADREADLLLVAESVAGLGEKYPDVTARVELASGFPDTALAALGEGMDLVVVGAHRGGAASAVLFGSIAASVVERVHCPVLVVPLR